MRIDASDTFLVKIVEYYERKVVEQNDITGFITIDNDSNVYILIKDEKDKKIIWRQSESEDRKDFALFLKNEYDTLSSNLNSIYGFITIFKKSYMVYKTLDTSNTSSRGARCNQNKLTTLKEINNNLGFDLDEITKKLKFKKITLIEQCIIQEIIMRYNNLIKKDGVRWFLLPYEFTLLHSKK